ncbi:glycoside hydrolase family 140 protein [Cohnella sp. GCM10012308]|uniref:glycoside hydrolase family 140 protein n=1 Tax=Cohnella sp. GCM10012308 TaxID=3317329 RepID=UPI00360FFDA8
MRAEQAPHSRTSAAQQRLKISDNGRYLVHEDGTPFFWLADTAWELFHKLDREEATHYLETRAAQGFNVVQAVALAEFEGATSDNRYGRRPLHANEEGRVDPTRPDTDGDYSYWDHVDAVIAEAARLGIYVALLPTWGDKINLGWGKGPEMFDPDNARVYGRWLGERYRRTPNIVWVLGGDRNLDTRRHFQTVLALAEGVREGDGGSHLATYHPTAPFSSSRQLHDEAWLDFNMIQSGHFKINGDNWQLVRDDYARLPVKPTLDGEPCYEDLPVNFDPANGYFDEADVRRAAYYAVLSGAFGHTYGHHSVWSMCDGCYASTSFDEPGAFYIMHWRAALERPGARQMRHLKDLIESRPYLSLAPAQELLASNLTGASYRVAAMGDGYAYIYCPSGLYVEADGDAIPAARVEASWYDPRTGARTSAGIRDASGKLRYDAPSSGRGCDWVLTLEWAD